MFTVFSFCSRTVLKLFMHSAQPWYRCQVKCWHAVTSVWSHRVWPVYAPTLTIRPCRLTPHRRPTGHMFTYLLWATGRPLFQTGRRAVMSASGDNSYLGHAACKGIVTLIFPLPPSSLAFHLRFPVTVSDNGRLLNPGRVANTRCSAWRRWTAFPRCNVCDEWRRVSVVCYFCVGCCGCRTIGAVWLSVVACAVPSGEMSLLLLDKSLPRPQPGIDRIWLNVRLVWGGVAYVIVLAKSRHVDAPMDGGRRTLIGPNRFLHSLIHRLRSFALLPGTEFSVGEVGVWWGSTASLWGSHVDPFFIQICWAQF